MKSPWDKSSGTVVIKKDDLDKNNVKTHAAATTSRVKTLRRPTAQEIQALEQEVTEVIQDTINQLNNLSSEDFTKSVVSYELKDPQSNNLGQILLGVSNLTPERLEEVLNDEKTATESIGEILIKKKYITEDELIQALSLQTGIPVAKDLQTSDIPEDLTSKIPISFAKKHALIPFKRKGLDVIVAMSDPRDLSPIDDVRILLGTNVKPALAKKGAILDAINRAYDRTSKVGDGIDQDLMDDLEGKDLNSIDLNETQDLLDSEDEAPIIRLVNTLLFRAVKERASDIHIEPFEKEISVRFRIDGIMYEIMKPPKKAQASITSRIKIMADLDIAEKRIPQDGRIKIKIGGRDIDIRVSTLPTSHGERIVMRLLDTSNVVLNLDDVGFSTKQLTIIKKVIHMSHGIFLVTGPTGSGKTTTLYACLSSINSKDRNIITVEDPVEIQLQGIGQIQVNPKVNLTFASGLRSILRQDPDVIMIGEIRDLETAEIAIQASLTGHFVFSTIHTNDAAGSITRLIDMGVEPFLVSSSLIAAMAQRLVRRLCPECKQPYMPSEAELHELSLSREQAKQGAIFRPHGCAACTNTGYQGRMGIYEILPIDEEIRSLIIKSSDSGTIKKVAAKHDVKTLRDDGTLKVLKGLTSIEEVLRVTQDDMVIE
ncbi:MAG: type II secretion system ATPase GspE [Bdellovibrionota bacterium]